MANRFQSIVDAIAESTLVELRDLWPRDLGDGHWYIDHQTNELMVEINGQHHVFEFAIGDPASSAIVLMLNNLNRVIQALGASNSETRIRISHGAPGDMLEGGHPAPRREHAVDDPAPAPVRRRNDRRKRVQ